MLVELAASVQQRADGLAGQPGISHDLHGLAGRVVVLLGIGSN